MTRTVQLSQSDVFEILQLMSEVLVGTCLALDSPDLELSKEAVGLDQKLALRARFLKAAGIICPLPAEVQEFLSRQSPEATKPLELFCRPKPKGVV